MAPYSTSLVSQQILRSHASPSANRPNLLRISPPRQPQVWQVAAAPWRGDRAVGAGEPADRHGHAVDQADLRVEVSRLGGSGRPRTTLAQALAGQPVVDQAEHGDDEGRKLHGGPSCGVVVASPVAYEGLCQPPRKPAHRVSYHPAEATSAYQHRPWDRHPVRTPSLLMPQNSREPL
jgi:hypothetical protein